ncbi:carbon-nitrogen hydrolase family protein [Pseudonocardia sp. TRM90224]|uniref:carbon-nitrogen hydrolase family protein n=1 Tax=Pseudonocardia sp. TRM90224 TaxID=2812678 RepID=UPI001E4E0603|nr:carbon-nitrogen hydrolase family protein [Pseudonocardia sp. TRM90224]
MTTNSFVAAAVQAEPVWLDADASTEKAIGIIGDAATAGASLVAFPEAWIPGYPAWIWIGSPLWGTQFVQRYHENSIVVGDARFERLRKAAADNSINVVLGASERAGGSIYMAQFLFGRDGEVVATRRKIKPTHVERSVFGEGDGSDLVVRDMPGVGRIGALNCWEHLQPLLRAAMYGMGEQVHVASWPNLAEPELVYALSHEANLRVSQVYALEGGCYVVAATTMLGEAGLTLFAQGDGEKAALLCGGSGGFAQVFAPDGRPIGRTLSPRQEGLVLADIDLGLLPLAKSLLDPTGHYGRPDVAQLLLNTEPRRPVVQMHGTRRPAAEPRSHARPGADTPRPRGEANSNGEPNRPTTHAPDTPADDPR